MFDSPPESDDLDPPKRNERIIFHGYSTNLPLTYPPPRNEGLIAGLIEGNQCLISPDHKALFLGGVRDRGVLVE